MDFLLQADAVEILLAGVFGLLLGSFLNVVIHRLPLMMEAQWDAECAAHAAHRAGQEYQPSAPTLTLSSPASRCPQCGHGIRWFENIPLASWLFLRGRCSHCQHRISVRYPLIELATGLLFAGCVARWGISPVGLVWCVFAAMLLALAMIDWDTTLLPDSMTLPLLWAGLLAANMGWTGVSPSQALWGAAAGYLSLWSVYWGFKLVMGKEGMGYGDFKLFAALGAWFGLSALVPIILMSSVIGIMAGIALKLKKNLREGGYIPFGPFLAGAGFTAMFWGPERMLQGMLRLLGL